MKTIKEKAIIKINNAIKEINKNQLDDAVLFEKAKRETKRKKTVDIFDL